MRAGAAAALGYCEISLYTAAACGYALAIFGLDRKIRSLSFILLHGHAEIFN